MNARETRGDQINASGFFVLRTPLLPFSDLEAWSGGIEAARHVDDPDELERALVRDRERLRERLRAVVARPDFRDALFVASSTLAEAIAEWRQDPDGTRGRTTEEALVAYFSRAAARPTPFGLFAGSTTGTIGATTSLRLAPQAAYRRESRLDMEYLSTLAGAIEQDPSCRRILLYRPNSSLYEIGGRFHYAEHRQTPSGRSYKLVAVEKTPYLAATLERAQDGARLDVLAAALVDDEVTRSDADEYVQELVESQILTADIGPQVTGRQPAEALLETLAADERTAPCAVPLREACSQLAAIDSDGLGASPQRYATVAAVLEDLPVAPPELSRLVQVDLIKPSANVTLGGKVVREIVQAVRVLHALAPVSAHDPMKRFRDEFANRYETRQVPLVEALDEEHGIGFDRAQTAADDTPPLLAGLPLRRPRDDGGRWTLRETFLLRKLTDAVAVRSSEITFEQAEVAAMRQLDRPPLPDAFEVVAALEAVSAQAVEEGDFRLMLLSVSGPPGARLLGRFCHLDEKLHDDVRQHLRAEEANRREAVFAEIVHQPEGRVGNILTRPVLRSHEIPYLGASGADPDRQIPVSDLLLSIENNMVVLRSGRLGCEVVPRLTTAHNYSRRSLRVYRFLCALANQGVVPGLMWHWGVLEAARFLPRVVSGRTVLSRARWNLGYDDLAAFRESRGGTQFAAVQALRAALTLPRWVALADADNELVVDLDNVLSVEALARQIRKRQGATLTEVFPAPDRLCVEGPEGQFTGQFVIPFICQRAPRPAAADRRPFAVARRFPPGSEWLYVKLFTGPATADVVLDRIARAVESSVASGAADRWFFIRYSDPQWHLRLRVHGIPPRLLAETLPALYATAASLFDSSRLWSVQLDTYEREVERYGGDRGILLAEEIFHADSEAVLEIVRAAGPGETDVRWGSALLGLHLLLDDFALTLDQKRDLVRRACRGYETEFGADSAFQREIGRRYRDQRPLVEALVGSRGSPPPAFGPIIDALQRRSEHVRPAAAELRGLVDSRAGTPTLHELVMSHCHMHVNRLLRSSQRAQELVLYEFLSRAYSSQAARR